MAEGTAISYNRIEPLNGNNYHVWALKVAAVLRARKLFVDVIEREAPARDADPESAAGKRRTAWENKNDEAFGILITTLSDEQAGQFLTESSAKKVWNDLKTTHAGSTEVRRIDIGLEFKNLRMGVNESVNDYIIRAKNIASRSACIGYVIESREITYHVIRGIHHKLEKVATVLRTHRTISLEEVQNVLLEEEARLGIHTSDELPGSSRWKEEKAYRATKQQQGSKYSGCFICGRINHKAKECYHRTDKQNVHKNKGNHKSYNNNYLNSRHSANEKKGTAKREQSSLATKGYNEYTFQVVENSFSLSSTPTESMKEIWTLDSGSTSHMSPNMDWMTNVRKYTASINLAEYDRAIECEAIGDIRVIVESEEGKEYISIKDVLHVPKLRANLLSVSKLNDNRIKVIFENKIAKIIGPDNRLIAKAYEDKGIYVLRTKPTGECRNTIEKDKEGVNESANSKKMLWHRRFGHVCEEYLDNMKSRDVIRHLTYETGKLKVCEPCVMGKLVEGPHRKVIETQARTPLELVHIDLCGPMPEASLGGSKYMFVLVDEYTKYVTVFLLQTKDETYDYFLKYMNECRNEIGAGIKRVRSDNGREFINRKFEELFRAKGIKHERTIPYNPQSNGVAERANRTLLDKARTMLIDADLPERFWGEAVIMAAYLKNRTISKADGQKTPQEKWNGRKPTASYLKVFGSMAYFHIPKAARSKFQPKAKRGIFVGYSKETKGYRIYDPEDKKIYVARSVKFNEEEKGALLLRKQIPGTQLKEQDYSLRINGRHDEREEDNGMQDVQTEEEENVTIEEERREYVEEQETGVHESQITDVKRGRKLGKSNAEIREERRKAREENEQKLRTEGARRSKRIEDRSQQVNLTTQVENNPNNYREAMNSSNSEKWKFAMQEELQNMKKHKVWELVKRVDKLKVIKSKWVYSTKKGEGKDNIKFKARLVAIGSGQKPGINYQESFAPVIKLDSVRVLLALASIYDLQIRQYDVKAAYLHATLEEPVYMEQPPGWEENEGKVCLLKKGLYGLPQSGHYWNKKISGILKSQGWKQVEEDPCIYKLENTHGTVILGLYVDDCLVIGTNSRAIETAMMGLGKHFEMTETEKKDFLNIRIQEKESGIELSQKGYIEKILRKYGLQDCNAAKTPMEVQQNLDDHEDSPKADQVVFQEMLGSLMYLAIGTRPDIAFPVSSLSRYSNCCKQVHLTALKRIYRYLMGTKDYKLLYKKTNNNVSLTTDASWNSTADAKSYSGFLVRLGGNLISWRSRKQDLVALSTCEAELISMCEGVQTLKWLCSLLENLEVDVRRNGSIVLETDSKAAMEWIRKDRVTNRTKHINRKYYFIKQEVIDGNINLQHVKTEKMLADMLTKPQTRDKLEHGCHNLGLCVMEHMQP